MRPFFYLNDVDTGEWAWYSITRPFDKVVIKKQLKKRNSKKACK
jgi:hypothetical protein